MTVSTSVNKSGPYAGAGSVGPFTVGFRFLAESHLQVIRTSSAGVDSTLTLVTDYSVAGVGAATGSVTLVAALAVGEKLTVVRSVPFTQDADYVNNDGFPAESHEDALDKLVMMAQQLKERIDLAITLAASSSGVSASLPSAEAGKLLGWNGAGTALVNVTPAGGATSVSQTSTAGSAVIPASTTANRDSPASAGYFRFNTTLSQFEGYNGSSWGGVGGASAGGVMYENSTTLTANYTLTTGKNALMAGPLTINSGVSLTIPSGQRLVVL